MESFQAVYQYLENLKKDLNNPQYIQKLVFENPPIHITPLSNKSFIHRYFNTELCRFSPFSSTSKLKIEWYKLEIQYIDKVFHATCRKFLTAIDHIDYHPSQIQNTARTKRSEDYAVQGYISPLLEP